MSKRFSIFVQEFGADYEVELCQTESNPEAVVDGLKQKTLMVHTGKPGRRRTKIPKYTNIRIVDNQVSASA